MTSNLEHKPVLLDDVLNNLSLTKNSIYVDCTLGGGGHCLQIIKKIEPSLVIGIDQDEFALNIAKKNLLEIKNNILYFKDNFKNLKNILGDKKPDNILIDLGVSSFQLDDKERGFSYHANYQLDMRMDQSLKLSAWNVVNEFTEAKISEIIKTFGEERFHNKIAANIIKERSIKPINTTLDLVDVIKKSIPAKFHSLKHPAKKSFQAIRIFVNNELDVLEKVLKDATDSLAKHGRLLVITFHSLEDKIVKQYFNSIGKEKENDKSPILTNNNLKFKIITRKAIIPSESEIILNNRSRSAKLRVIEKL